MKFCERLKDLRMAKGITQDEFAKLTGLSRSAVGMYENGKREPNLETLELIADFYNVDLNYLLGKEGKSSYYLDPDTAQLAQELHDNPQYRAMLDASRKLSPEAMKEVMNFIKFQRQKEGGGND